LPSLGLPPEPPPPFDEKNKYIMKNDTAITTITPNPPAPSAQESSHPIKKRYRINKIILIIKM